MATQDFTVTGRGDFPLDMLRFDECWPVDVVAVAGMQQEGVRAICLRTKTMNGCHPARWDSFGWRVSEIDGVSR